MLKNLKFCLAICTVLIATIINITSCSKGNTPTPNNNNGNGNSSDNSATITSFSPTSGTTNTSVVISGTNFSTTQADNKVFFNGKTAAVTAATATQLTVTVPLNAGTGVVTISINGGATITGPTFTYNDELRISSIDVASGSAGDVVKISGTGFSTTLANNNVSFNGKTATVTAATTTLLTVTVPQGASTGSIKLSVAGGPTITGPTFIYVEPTPLAIVSADLSRGIAGATVNIIGTGFSTTATDDKIFFNGKAANVTYATTTHLIVTVPQGAGCGKITATLNNKTVTGPNFDYYLSSTVSTLAGGARVAFKDGTGNAAAFDYISRLCVDNTGNIYAVDYQNHAIRKITPSGTVTTLVGNGSLSTDVPGDPGFITTDNNGNIYYSVSGVGIYKINTSGVVSAFYTTPSVSGLASDQNNNIYFSNGLGGLIERITSTGATIVAGSGPGAAKDGTGINATFYSPANMVVAASGNIYLSDINPTDIIRIINTSTQVSTFANIGVTSIAIDKNENLYVSSSDNSTIKFIDHATGAVSIIAASSGFGYYVDGDQFSAAFSRINAIALDAAGNIYVADGDRIRKITTK